MKIFFLLKIDKISKRKGAKCISTYDFSTLYTKVEHSSLMKVLNSLVGFTFKGGIRESICIESKETFSYKVSNCQFNTFFINHIIFM